jgi:hypothetical protein
MGSSQNSSFDGGTITFLRTVLEDTWDYLGPEQRASTSKSLLAERILRAAAQGERDPGRLRLTAIEACRQGDIIRESIGE